MSQDARDALERFKAIVMKGSPAQIYHFATAAGTVTGKERVTERPAKEDLGKQLAELLFPKYNWEEPQLRKRRRPTSNEEEEEEEGEEEEDEVEEDKGEGEDGSA